MRTFFSAALALLLAIVTHPVQADDADIVSLMQTATDQVLQRFYAREDELKANPNRIYDAVQDLVKPHFDFEEMTRSSMGRHWSSATSAQQKQLVNEFSELLIRTYGVALLNYSGKPIDYAAPRRSQDNKRVMVSSKVTALSGNVVPIDYRLHRINNQWRVYDVAIEGISLVTNYRTTFANEVRAGGVEGLINRLVERNRSANS